MKKAKKTFLTSAILFAVFVVYTVLVQVVNVGELRAKTWTGTGVSVSDITTKVGFSSLNGAISDAIGVSMVWYHITDILGYLALLVVVFFGMLGVLQMIKRRSLLKVDADILALGGFYVLVLLCYVLFEVVKINYRPVILDAAEGLEASYPSSHTMLAVCVFTTAILQFNSRLKTEIQRKVAALVCLVLLVLTVAGRFAAGVHWATDIVGGLLLSASLIVLYCGAVIALGKRHRR